MEKVEVWETSALKLLYYFDDYVLAADLIYVSLIFIMTVLLLFLSMTAGIIIKISFGEQIRVGTGYFVEAAVFMVLYVIFYFILSWLLLKRAVGKEIITVDGKKYLRTADTRVKISRGESGDIKVVIDNLLPLAEAGFGSYI